MKKLTLSVAALLIAGMSYAQTDNDRVNENHYRTLDLIDAIRMDMFYGRLDQATGNYYINELVKIQNNSAIIREGDIKDYITRTIEE